MHHASRAARIAVLITLSGCADTGRVPTNTRETPPESTCPTELADHVRVFASAVARNIPRDLHVDDSFEGGTLGRRLQLSVSVTGAARNVTVISSVLTVTSLGGTFKGWAARNADVRTTDANQAIDVIPGRLRITPFLDESPLHPQTISLDVLIAPGGNPVDEMAVSTTALWASDRRPLPPDTVQVTLTPLRHFALYDRVEAKVSLQFTAARSRSARERWQCGVESEFILADRNELMPKLWDLRQAAPTGRSEFWLALFGRDSGPFRAIFTSPAEADRFAIWVRQTKTTRIGSYQLGLFQPDYSGDARRTLPARHSIIDTYRPVAADDLNELVVGRLGEP